MTTRADALIDRLDNATAGDEWGSAEDVERLRKVCAHAARALRAALAMREYDRYRMPGPPHDAFDKAIAS